MTAWRRGLVLRVGMFSARRFGSQLARRLFLGLYRLACSRRFDHRSHERDIVGPTFESLRHAIGQLRR